VRRLFLRVFERTAVGEIGRDACRPKCVTTDCLRVRFSLLHSNLNNFLLASICDEPNRMPHSVISASTRLGIDPWEEADQLAALQKPLALETPRR
jgi:hypothetical protein